MVNILKKPYPFNDLKTRVLISLSIAIFIFFFLVLFQPFNLHQHEYPRRVWLILGHSLCVMIGMSATYIIAPLIFRNSFDSRRWKVYKEIGFLIIIIAVVGLLVSGFEDITHVRTLSMEAIMDTQLKVFTIGTIPVTLLTFLNHIRLYRKITGELAEFHNHEQPLENQLNQDKLIRFLSNNKDEDIEILVSELIYIESAGNYVEIYYVQNNIIKKYLLRNTISQVHADIESYPNLIRTHRSYIVNLDRISKVEGSARGYELSFGFEGKNAIVSRRRAQEFRELWKKQLWKE